MDDPQEKTADQEFCEKESDQAYDTIAQNQEEYDKQLLALSTGLLAVLVAFLKDVVHLDSAVYRPVLYIALAGLGLTVTLVIVSFQISIHALEKVREYYQERYQTGSAAKFPDKWGQVVKAWNRAAGLSFIVGVALTIAFITINLAYQHGEKVNEVHEDSRGSNSQDSNQSGRGTWHTNQGFDPACPKDEHCIYKHRIEEDSEVGTPMPDKTTTAHDGALTKTPITTTTQKTNKTAGHVPKTPISTGSTGKK